MGWVRSLDGLWDERMRVWMGDGRWYRREGGKEGKKILVRRIELLSRACEARVLTTRRYKHDVTKIL